ncbi:MAG: WxL domain-containing protein [Actinomycetota bacterium]|nr:WxL domain-containing protein [Actinomycetota bacterium]
MNRNHLRCLLATSATALLVGAVAAPAAAAPTNAKVGGGALSVSGVSVPDFPGATLDGQPKAVTAAMANFSVSDARGNGFGWNVTVQATQFAEWDAATATLVSGGKTLALNSLKLPTPAVTADGTTSPPPSVVAGPHRIDTTGAVKIASAATDTGMGKYNFSVADPLELTIPANAYAKTYRSTVTLSVVSGP